nr:MAG TPA: hypothetical protein [Caudoviricetes sp.]
MNDTILKIKNRPGTPIPGHSKTQFQNITANTCLR